MDNAHPERSQDHPHRFLFGFRQRSKNDTKNLCSKNFNRFSKSTKYRRTHAGGFVNLPRVFSEEHVAYFSVRMEGQEICEVTNPMDGRV